MSRRLIIGIGGSGCNIVKRLSVYRAKGCFDDASDAMFAIDTDVRDLNQLSALGIPNIQISSDRTVEGILNNLNDDKFKASLPRGEANREFLTSPTYNGASQSRMKSRICLADLLSNPNNALRRTLNQINNPCATTTANGMIPFKVVIISSIAGGTGAGTFLQVALYVRKYFRDNNIDIEIDGVFLCPEIFETAVFNRNGSTGVQSIYSNAYAITRELNAITSMTAISDAHPEGRSINISIDNNVEGRLLLPYSKNPAGRTAKAYNNMYFLSNVNANGQVYTSIPEFYDIATEGIYTSYLSGVYSTMEATKSNYAASRTTQPNCIYGSFGIASVRYPVESIFEYVGSRRLLEEIADTENSGNLFSGLWSTLETKWKRRCNELKRYGNLPQTDTELRKLRAETYVTDYNTEIANSGNAAFSTLRKTVPESKTSDYLQTLQKTIAEVYLSDNNRTLKKLKQERQIDGLSLGAVRTNLIEALLSKQQRLLDYCDDLSEYVETQVSSIAGKIIPIDRAIAGYEDKMSIKNLLTDENGDYLHPVVARFLLYSLLSEMEEYIINESKNKSIVRERLVNSATGEDQLTPFTKERKGGKRTKGNTLTQGLFTKEFSTRVSGVENEALKVLLCNAYKLCIDRLKDFILCYEKFFDNLDETTTKLRERVHSLSVIHDNYVGRIHYVGAGHEQKDRLYRLAINNAPAFDVKTVSASGCGLFTAATEILQRNNAIGEDIIDSATSYGQAIEYICEEYIDYYKDNEDTRKLIDVNVFDAIIENAKADFSQANGRVADLTNLNDYNLICSGIRNALNDCYNMATPLIQHSAAAVPNEPDGEEKTNTYLCLSHEAYSSFVSLIRANEGFETGDTARALNAFNATLAAFGLVVSSADPVANYPKYDISFYKAVECLQTYQIPKFNELDDGLYYANYRKRIDEVNATKATSLSPHLDIGWHVYGVLPYVNRRMEIYAREKVAKAFIAAFVNNEIYLERGNYYHNNTRILDSNSYSVPFTNISAVVEYIAQDSLLVDSYVERLDACIAEIARNLPVDSARNLFESEITKTLLIKYIRNEFRFNESKSDPVPYSLLETAYSVKLSEERGVDHDYAEDIVNAMLGIFDKLARSRYGAALDNNVGYSQIDEYRMIYNHCIKVTIRDYISLKESRDNVVYLVDSEADANADSDDIEKEAELTEETVLPRGTARAGALTAVRGAGYETPKMGSSFGIRVTNAFIRRYRSEYDWINSLCTPK